MDYKDYYSILGVKKSDNAEELKKQYRKLARKYHPEVNKDSGSEQKVKDIGEAYAVLKAPEKREAYDQYGADWKTGQQQQEQRQRYQQAQHSYGNGSCGGPGAGFDFGGDSSGQGMRIHAWRFPFSSIEIIRKVVRLQNDLRVNLAGVALTLHLLERIAQLEMEININMKSRQSH